MSIIPLMVLIAISSSLSSSQTTSLEQVMRDTLRQVMRCPEWPTDETADQPVAAFSPARYMQLVALVRKDSKENSCGRTSHLPFHLNNPRSWNFCTMGICSEDSCVCFKSFVGEKCSRFHDRCWLFYCRLIGCNQEAPTLYCSCNPLQYGTPVSRRIYFYDHGFETSFIPPPSGYNSDSYVSSHLIKETAPGQYEIIGGNGNYYPNGREKGPYNARHEDKRNSNLPRFNYVAPIVHRQNELNFRKNLFEKHYDDGAELSHVNAKIPNYYKTLEAQNDPYYNPNKYKWNQEDNEPGVRTASPAIYKNVNRYNVQPDKRLSQFIQRRKGRTYRTELKKPINYVENANRVDFQYPNQQYVSKWQSKGLKTPYLIPEKPNRNYDSSNSEWYRTNYQYDSNSKGFPYVKKNVEESNNFADDYRIKREQLNPPSEQYAVQDTDEEEADDSEDFKFFSGSQANRSSFLQAFLCSAFILFIHFFLQ